MEVVVNEGRIYGFKDFSEFPDSISVSIDAHLLLYEYGYKDHAICKREAINRGMYIGSYNEALLEWKRYIVGKSYRPAFSFSKDLRYMLGCFIHINRDNPLLMRVIRELGVGSRRYIDDNFVIKTIPDDIADWKICVWNHKETIFIKEKDDTRWYLWNY